MARFVSPVQCRLGCASCPHSLGVVEPSGVVDYQGGMQGLLIAGERRQGQGVIPVIEPASGVPFDEVAAAAASDLDAAVAAARAVFPAWPRPK